MKTGTVRLDYGAAASNDLLLNISGCAASGDYVWTVSDEGRTLERLVRSADGFRLDEQIALDDHIPGIPGADRGKEIDLESIDVVGNQLWLCGSHCRVRKKPEQPGVPNPTMRDRPSRQMLGRILLRDDGATFEKGMSLRFDGSGSLRDLLTRDAYLGPFMDLPSKENGLDIEGILATEGGVLLGLRGPLIDGAAVVVELDLGADLGIEAKRLHFLDLQGSGVRDLCRFGGDVLVLAGPMSEATGPFRLLKWNPHPAPQVQSATEIYAWPSTGEKPEGICAFAMSGRDGLMVVYDNPDPGRIAGSTYLADWIAEL